MKGWRGVAGLTMAVAVACCTGCSVRAQQAYSIDGAVTTIDNVATLAQGCSTALGGSTSMISAAGLVSDMINADLAHLVAAQNNIAYTDAELLEPIQDGSLGELVQMMAGDPTCARLAMGLTLQVLVTQELGTQAAAQGVDANAFYLTQTSQFDVAVNPRFGAWDPSKLALSGSGSFSTEGQ
jgi:hypothetical protein